MDIQKTDPSTWNLFSEREATIEQFCPFIRPEIDGDFIHCLGGDCMAWRWHRTSLDDDNDSNDLNTLGYCGLAGKP